MNACLGTILNIRARSGCTMERVKVMIRAVGPVICTDLMSATMFFDVARVRSSFRTWMVKSTSWALMGLPSCHTPSRM